MQKKELVLNGSNFGYLARCMVQSVKKYVFASLSRFLPVQTTWDSTLQFCGLEPCLARRGGSETFPCRLQ